MKKNLDSIVLWSMVVTVIVFVFAVLICAINDRIQQLEKKINDYNVSIWSQLNYVPKLGDWVDVRTRIWALENYFGIEYIEKDTHSEFYIKKEKSNVK